MFIYYHTYIYTFVYLAEGARGSHQLAERKDGGGASVYTCIFYMCVYIYII